MVNPTYPGVYVQEVSGGARPIAVASTATPAFVGFAEKGPDDAPTRVTGWDQFQRLYGGFVSGSYLPESVYEFFNNGGAQCYIVRVNGSSATKASVKVMSRAAYADTGAGDGAGENGVTFTASSNGEWGNRIYVRVADAKDDPGDRFTLDVFEQDDANEAPSEETANAVDPVEVHESLSMDEGSPDYFVTRLERDSLRVRGALEAGNDSLIQGYHLGSEGIQLPLGDNVNFEINIDGDGFQLLSLAGIETETVLENVRQKIESVVKNLKKRRLATPDDAFGNFTCSIVDAKKLKLTSGTEAPTSSVRIRPPSVKSALSQLKLGPAENGISYGGLSQRRPQPVSLAGDTGIYALGDHPTSAVRGADDHGGMTLSSYETAFRCLDVINDFSMLAVPGVPNLFDAGVTYCENRPLRDVFFIGETEMTDDQPSEAKAAREEITKPNSYGALYFPWILAPDPSGRESTPVRLPPSGFIAGLYARTDKDRGVWKAPAGTSATVSGASGLLAELNDIEQGNLNRIGVNCIRRFDLAGIVSWGARTVTSDPEYLYVPVRRTAIMLRKSIYEGVQWAVFEPNDHRLWSALKLNIESFMNGLFRAGAFQGEKASDAYFVRCGLGDTMTQGDIDRGQVIVRIGFAPLKPAEFVIVEIQQAAGQS